MKKSMKYGLENIKDKKNRKNITGKARVEIYIQLFCVRIR